MVWGVPYGRNEKKHVFLDCFHYHCWISSQNVKKTPVFLRIMTKHHEKHLFFTGFFAILAQSGSVFALEDLELEGGFGGQLGLGLR